MKNYIVDILKFIKRPNDLNFAAMKNFNKVKLFIVALFFQVLLNTIFLLFTELLKYLNVNINDTSELEKMFWENPIFIWILIVLIMPVIEELVFRSQIRFKDNILIKMILPKKSNAIYESKNIYLREKWDRYYPIIFYSSVLLFGLAHYSNFNSNDNAFWSLIVLFLPLFISGIILGYVRVRINLIASILLHSIFNFIAITLAILLT